MIDFGILKGKTIVITGATKGIGRETAILLSKLGANLVLGARSENELDALSRDLETTLLAIPLDVSNEDSVRQFTEKAILRFEKIDALINCAGNGTFQSALELSVKDFDNMISVNLRGTFLCCKYIGQHMVKQQSGKMINIVSISGTTALPGCGGYSASKFGVLGLSRVLQAELRSKGVQVMSVMPGAIATSFWDHMETKPDSSLMIPVQSLAKHLIYLLCQPEGAIVDEITIMPPLGIL